MFMCVILQKQEQNLSSEAVQVHISSDLTDGQESSDALTNALTSNLHLSRNQTKAWHTSPAKNTDAFPEEALNTCSLNAAVCKGHRPGRSHLKLV